MPANTAPIFSLRGDAQWGSVDGNGGAAGPLKTANAAMDGTGTVLTVFTASAEGGWVEDLILVAAGTNIASVARVFLNNGATNATLANNAQIGQQGLPATTAVANAANPTVRIPIRMALPAGFKINITLGTTVAAGWIISANGNRY